MYVCGPTVWDRAHIGNARPVVVFDVLYRLLQAKYPSVKYVRNITDVDDKIIDGAAKQERTIAELTETTIAAFHADMGALNCLPPTVEPLATAHIAQMIAMNEKLTASGHAYVVEGHVLFDVPNCPDYGALSGRNRDEQIAGARVDVAPYKRDPADFVLWKPSPDDYPGWNSPWGRGRPGWHIECSAMAATHLGEQFDIHGGGIDLIFPHHENEVAQSRCAHGMVPARLWMHNGHVVVGGQKMSKSLGNFVTVEDLLQKWPGEVIRLALLSAHYRQPLDVTDELLAASKARLDYFYGVLRRSEAAGDLNAEAVQAALEDDLNTPQALTDLQELAREVERSGQGGKALKHAAALLGLLQAEPEDWFRWQVASATELSPATIEGLIEERRVARTERNFARADQIRKDLLAQGIALEDEAGGTFWRRVTPETANDG
jgi:cysteinyl-tRNA synthetase